MFRAIKKYLFISIVAVAIIVGFFLIKNTTNSDVFAELDDPQLQLYGEYENQPNSILNDETKSELILVDIKGEIKSPGVYEFQNGARVNDLVLKAGGFLETADETQVNLAQKLQDEMIIIVPQETVLGDEPNSISKGNGQVVRVNYATKEELEILPGIGPSKAMAIIEYREQHGFFGSIHDLINISGIGEKTLENLEEYIQVP